MGKDQLLLPGVNFIEETDPFLHYPGNILAGNRHQGVQSFSVA
jgi:hypothetical protein